MSKNRKKRVDSNSVPNKKDDVSYNSKGNRYNGRGGRKPSAFENSIDDPKAYINNYTSSKENDPSWYTVNSQLVNDAAKLPFGNMVGEKLNLRDDASIGSVLSVPGIAVLATRPTIGYSRDETSAPSRAAIAITEFLRSKLTTDESFATPDVFMYLNAMDSILSLYSHITRLFGLLSAVKYNNLFTPKTLVKAIYGFDDAAWEDAIQNRANYTLLFNQYIVEAQFLYLPISFTAVERHSWLYSNVFYDARSNKAQMYAHTPVGFYIWDEVTADTGTTNQFLNIRNLVDSTPYRHWYEQHNMKSLIELFHKMCYAMINSTSQLRIRMAFLKAYGESSGWRMKSLEDNYLIAPVHSDEVLSQINNTTVCDIVERYGYRMELTVPEGTLLPDGSAPAVQSWNADPFTIFQDPNNNAVICTPFIREESLPNQYQLRIKSREILNFHWDNPSTDDILVATRDTISFERLVYPLNEPCWNLTGMGCDIVTEVSYIIDPEMSNTYHLGYIAVSGGNYDAIRNWVAFDWAPPVWVTESASVSAKNFAPIPFQEWDNCNTVDKSSLIQLHKAVLTSMYQVKEAGMYTP